MGLLRVWSYKMVAMETGGWEQLWSKRGAKALKMLPPFVGHEDGNLKENTSYTNSWG